MALLDLSVLADQASNWATVIAAIISAVSLWTAILVNHDAKKPQIIVSLEFNPDKNAVLFLVQNLGEGVAYDISFSEYDESIFMDKYRQHAMNSFVKKGIPILVPGSKRSTIAAAGRIMDAMHDKKSAILVTYYERGLIRRKKRVKEPLELDYSSFSGSLHTDSELHLIRKSLQTISKSTEELAGSIEAARRQRQQ